MNEEKVLEIMQPGAEISDEQLALMESDADLREACQDVMMIQGMLAEKPDAEAALEHFHTRYSTHGRRRSTLKWGLAIAAALIGAILLLRHTVFLNPSTLNTQHQTPDVRQNLVALQRPDGKADAIYEVPVKQTKKRSVFGYELASQPADSISYSAMEIPLGSSMQLTLGDGTRVYMHPGARLVYPECFVGHERRVILTGEAYFCVTHDASCPFVVSTPQGDVCDYGTEFNVNASERQTEVVLVEGSVGVTSHSGQEYLLKPGQKLSMDAARWTVENTDTDPFLAWRDGYFYYDQQMLGDIVKQLVAFYNLKLECYNQDLLSLRLRYIVPRNSTPQYAVEILNRLQKGHIFLEGNSIIVK